MSRVTFVLWPFVLRHQVRCDLDHSVPCSLHTKMNHVQLRPANHSCWYVFPFLAIRQTEQRKKCRHAALDHVLGSAT